MGCSTVQVPRRWKYPTHRSKSWEELAKKARTSCRPVAPSWTETKAGIEFLKSREGPCSFFAYDRPNRWYGGVGPRPPAPRRGALFSNHNGQARPNRGNSAAPVG